MELILNEHAFAQQAIACGTVGKKPAQTLGCISRYLCYEGYEKPQIEETLHRFMRENYANYHAVQWSAAIEHISSRADRRPLLQANQIEITQEELASIRRSQASLWNGFALHCYALQNMLNSLTRPTMAGSRRNGALFSAWPMCRRERRGRLPCCIPCGKS